MALIQCPECHKKISEKANNCPKCGYYFKEGETAKIKKKERSIKMVIVIIIIGIIVLWQMNSPYESIEDIGASNKNRQTNIQANKFQNGTIDKLKYEVKKILGSSNRGVSRVIEIQEVDKKIKVLFAINDNLTNGMIKTGAQMDAMEILKAIQSSDYQYSEIVLNGTFPLVDKYGNSEETIVLKTLYSPDKVSKVNWHNFLYDNIYEIADSVWLHPTFR